jgi:SAM-dependent methyltransferase
MVRLNYNPNRRQPYFLLRSELYKAIFKYKDYMSGKMMDFGCGSSPYKPLFSHVDSYIGVDYQGEGHSHESEEIDVFYDGKVLPFEDGHFDSIFSTEVFEHVFNLPDILTELNRVLKPGGRILFTCPFVWIEHEAPADFARYTRFALKSMAESAGFRIVIEDKTGNYITAMAQLKIFYDWQYVLPKLLLSDFPVIKNIYYHYFITLPNFVAEFKSKFYPFSRELYLNNVFVIEKN